MGISDKIEVVTIALMTNESTKRCAAHSKLLFCALNLLLFLFSHFRCRCVHYAEVASRVTMQNNS